MRITEEISSRNGNALSQPVTNGALVNKSLPSSVAVGPYIMPFSNEERRAVLTAPVSAEGHQKLVAWLTARFDTVQSQTVAEYRARADRAQIRYNGLQSQHTALVHARDQMQSTAPDPRPTAALPSGISGWGVLFLYVLLILDTAAGWVNLAGFAVNHTQDWVRALLFAVPLVILPIVLKYVIGQPHGIARSWLLRGLTLLGGVASVAFILSFAQHFAYEPPSNDLLAPQGPIDMRLQVVSQFFLSLMVGVGLLCYIRSLMAPVAQLMPNRDWELLASQSEAVQAQLDDWAARMESARQAVQVYDQAKKAYVLKWESTYLTFLEERRRSAERLSLVEDLSS